MSLLGSLFGHAKINKTTQNSNTTIDDVSQGRTQDIWNAAVRAGNAGQSPLLTGASDYNNRAIQAGNLGFGALSGDQTAAAQLMNPYQQQVIDANNAQWQKTNMQTANQVNDAATRAGAFGGSRHGVAEGIALGNNNAAQAQQTAGLLNTGYQGAMNQASQLAQFGAQGANANSNLGFNGVGNPQQWLLNMLNQGYHGPQGSQTSGARTETGYNS